MIDRLRSWYRSAALRNVAKLSSGTVIAQVLPILFFPILSRLYSPGDYGILGLFMGISMLLAIVATLQLNLAVLIPKSDSEAIRVVMGGVQWVAVFSVALLGLAAGGAKHVGQWLSAPALVPWLYLLPFTVFLSGVSTQLSAWFSRTAQFGTISVSRIFASVLTVACSLGFYFVIPGAAGLVVSYTFGTLVTCGYLMFRFAQFHSITSLSFGEMRMLVGRHRNFPLYTMPTELIGNFAQQLPLFIFTSFSGAQSAGLFSRSRQILGLPITYIGSSVAEVYRQKASDLFRTNPAGLRPLFFKTIGSLTAISVIPFTVGVVYSPQLFAWLFGEPWRQAGVFTQYLSIMYFFKFVISPVTFNFMLAGRQRLDFVMHFIILIVTPSVLVFGLNFLGSETMAIALFSGFYALIYIVYGFVSHALVVARKTYE